MIGRMYFLRVSFNDSTDDQILDLRGLDLGQAESFAGELRYEVEQAGEIGAPVVQLAVPGIAEPMTFEPGRIVGIDLEEGAGDVVPTAAEPAGAGAELDDTGGAEALER